MLITPPALAARLADPLLVLLDASWYLPSANRDPRAEYRAAHLPGARFFDLDAACEPNAPLPHTLPSDAHFTTYAATLGVRADSTVVVYDASGANLSAARAWWMFRAYGLRDVHLLDGGLGAWRRAGLPLESGEPAPLTPDPTLALALDRTRTIALDELVATPAQKVDARSPSRFSAREPEPRAGLRSGHMPGARNVHYASLVDGEGRLLDEPALRARFAAAGVDLARPIVATCGSGVSACAVLLALETLGVRGRLYGGSWAEWGADPALPVETGDAAHTSGPAPSP